ALLLLPARSTPPPYPLSLHDALPISLALGPADPPGDIDHVCAHRRSSLGFHWFCVHCMKKPTHSYSRLARDLLRLATGPPPITPDPPVQPSDFSATLPGS